MSGRVYLTVPAAVRFHAKIDMNGPTVRPELGPCHLWLGAVSDTGYGGFNRGDGVIVGAHRFAFELETGMPPPRLVLHKCDVKRCVRGSHLFDGTYKDNVDDMDRKGRRVNAQPRGEEHGRAKLTEVVVEEARRTWSNRGKNGRGAKGVSLRTLAKKYGVAPTTLHQAIVGKTWGA